MPATIHFNGAFKPATDRFGDFTVSHAPHGVLSPEQTAREVARKHHLIGAGFVVGLIALFGTVSLMDRTLFPEPVLTAQEEAYFAQAYD